MEKDIIAHSLHLADQNLSILYRPSCWELPCYASAVHKQDLRRDLLNLTDFAETKDMGEAVKEGYITEEPEICKDLTQINSIHKEVLLFCTEDELGFWTWLMQTGWIIDKRQKSSRVRIFLKWKSHWDSTPGLLSFDFRQVQKCQRAVPSEEGQRDLW